MWRLRKMCALLVLQMWNVATILVTGSVISNSPSKVSFLANETIKLPGQTSFTTGEHNERMDTVAIGLGLSNTSLVNDETEKVELRKKPWEDSSSSGVPGSIVNIPILGKPEVQVQPPDIIEIITGGKPTVQFIEQPSIQLQLVPVPNEIPIASKPEIVLSTGPSPLFQIPLLPQISIANPFTSLFGNNFTSLFGNNFTLSGLLKPPKPLFGFLGFGGGKPSKPKPLYIKIINAINKIQGKLLEITGLGSVLPNSTTIQAYGDNVITLIKVLMMDTPF